MSTDTQILTEYILPTLTHSLPHSKWSPLSYMPHKAQMVHTEVGVWQCIAGICRYLMGEGEGEGERESVKAAEEHMVLADAHLIRGTDQKETIPPLSLHKNVYRKNPVTLLAEVAAIRDILAGGHCPSNSPKAIAAMAQEFPSLDRQRRRVLLLKGQRLSFFSETSDPSTPSSVEGSEEAGSSSTPSESEAEGVASLDVTDLAVVLDITHAMGPTPSSGEIDMWQGERALLLDSCEEALDTHSTHNCMDVLSVARLLHDTLLGEGDDTACHALLDRALLLYCDKAQTAKIKSCYEDLSIFAPYVAKRVAAGYGNVWCGVGAALSAWPSGKAALLLLQVSVTGSADLSEYLEIEGDRDISEAELTSIVICCTHADIAIPVHIMDRVTRVVSAESGAERVQK
ncbi:hypothetical protein KIPB_011081, partial [Kipferlia bialata]|eukprot:g11081.t1